MTDTELRAAVDFSYQQMMRATLDVTRRYWMERLKAYAAMAKRRRADGNAEPA